MCVFLCTYNNNQLKNRIKISGLYAKILRVLNQRSHTTYSSGKHRTAISCCRAHAVTLGEDLRRPSVKQIFAQMYIRRVSIGDHLLGFAFFFAFPLRVLYNNMF